MGHLYHSYVSHNQRVPNTDGYLGNTRWEWHCPKSWGTTLDVGCLVLRLRIVSNYCANSVFDDGIGMGWEVLGSNVAWGSSFMCLEIICINTFPSFNCFQGRYLGDYPLVIIRGN
jgi:hypothetical protein